MKFLILFLSLFSISVSAENKISMDDYIHQVKKNNPSYKASEEAREGAKLRFSEGTLLVLPQLGVEYAKGVDEKETYVPAMNGEKRETEIYKISLTEVTPFGLQGKLSFGQNYYLVQGSSLNPTFVPQPEYYTTAATLELSQSLWRNGLGSEIRSIKTAINSAAEATHYAQKAQNIGLIVEAQNTFYRLYYAQKTVAAVKESLSVASRLRDWAKKRLNQGLGEESDYLQTKAAYELRELEYQSALQEEKLASRAFNSMRGSDTDQVAENLSEVVNLEISKFNLQEKWRDDVRAAQKSAEAAKANNIANKEKNKPSLDIFANYTWNGLDTSDSTARDESLKNDFQTYLVGVRFTAPLAFGKSSNVREGYSKEALAAELNFRRKEQEQTRDANDLQFKIENSYARLKLSKSLEGSQRLKVQIERRRHQKGRTTFFQVLQFEQDYLNSQLNKIKNEAEFNSLLTQTQLYTAE